MALAVLGQAKADDLTYLTAAYNSVEQSFELSKVQKITFENDNVVITTTEGATNLPQDQMEKIYFSATATAIQGVAADATDTAQGEAIYDLSGRRVSSAQKGIYIIKQGDKAIKVLK